MKTMILLALFTGLLASNSAWAGSHLETTRSNCTGINCAGMTVRGKVQGAEPFVIQVFAQSGECLRLDVTSQTQDLAMALTGPTVLQGGAIADDRDPPNDLRPVIVYNLLDATGWYTVIVSLRDLANVDARFTLEYGRYPGGNPNCLSS